MATEDIDPHISKPAPSNPRLLAFLILGFLALVWGSSFILIKLGLAHGFKPVEIGAARLIFAAGSLMPFALRYMKKLSRSEVIAIMVVGLVGTGIPATLFPLAQTVISSTTSGMLNSLAPLFTLLLGVVFFGFPFHRRKLWGVLLGLVGAAVLILMRETDGTNADFWKQVLFALIAVVATLGYGLSTNVMKRYLNETHPLMITALASTFVAIPYAVFLFGFSDLPGKIIGGDSVLLEGLLYVAFLGVFGTGIALLLFNKLVQLTDAVVSSSVTYLIPIVALGWGIVDGEKIGWAHVIGMITILIGVWIVNTKGKRAALPKA